MTLAVAAADDVIAHDRAKAVAPRMAIDPSGPEYWNGPVDWTVDQWWVTWYYPWAVSGGSIVPKQVGCVGSDVLGNAYAMLSRSEICAAARNDANIQCWNRYCIGCCFLGECDAFCVLEPDYFCVVAGVS